jgi:hypothetical protein
MREDEKETEEEGGVGMLLAASAVAPDMNYQGRLLDDSGNPVTGTVSMKFRLYDDPAAGTLVWGPQTKSVTVTDGLFNTELSNLDVEDFDQALWLEIEIIGSGMLSPRQQLMCAPYAFSLVPGAEMLGSLTGPLLTVDNTNWHGIEGRSYDRDGVRGISYGGGAAGHGVYGETDSTSVANAGVYGKSTSNAAGGYFRSDEGDGVYAYSSGSDDGDCGVFAYSNEGKGVYAWSTGSDDGDHGVYAYSNEGDGVHARSKEGKGVYAYSAGSDYDDYGVYAYSNEGDGVYAYSAGSGDYDCGVEAWSNEGDGVYGVSTGSDDGDHGVEGYSNNGCGVYGRSPYNIGVYGDGGSGSGDYGGYFTGGWMGLYAEHGSCSHAAYFDGHIYADGNIYKSGSVSFVKDHPTDPTKEIVYVCLEGGETGTYTRGSAQLTNGEATVKLPDDFRLVTSSEGITVQVTPTGDCKGIYVSKKSNSTIVVAELGGGKSDATFDYLVNGIRIGYEDYQPIQDKDLERRDSGVDAERIAEEEDPLISPEPRPMAREPAPEEPEEPAPEPVLPPDEPARE